MDWLQKQMPKIVLAPSFIAVIIFVYGFIAWTTYVSFTRSRLLPKYEIEAPSSTSVCSTPPAGTSP